jgi:dTDP-L-rhamnose 4-epimerase
MHALITGGAGFIGSHLADLLLAQGHRVRVLDSLAPRVHGAARRAPSYLKDDVELRVGDVRDAGAVAMALQGVDCVFHLAALVGAGQGMSQAAEMVDVNVRGTAVLLEEIAKRPVQRLVVTSSRRVYGEGAYVDAAGRPVSVPNRPLEQLKRGEWELTAASGARLVPMPTHEAKPLALDSVYALTKFDQERLALTLGRTCGIPTVALRLFNVYGPRQALANPASGVLASFAARLLEEEAPLPLEDGEQQRDFVSVHDVVAACLLALERDEAVGQVLNIGSGQPRTLSSVAQDLAAALGKSIQPEATGEYRAGDIRHCFADIARAQHLLGYRPRIAFSEGLTELGLCLTTQAQQGAPGRDRVPDSLRQPMLGGLSA